LRMSRVTAGNNDDAIIPSPHPKLTKLHAHSAMHCDQCARRPCPGPCSALADAVTLTGLFAAEQTRRAALPVAVGASGLRLDAVPVHEIVRLCRRCRQTVTALEP
jgi:hypothetical protein